MRATCEVVGKENAFACRPLKIGVTGCNLHGCVSCQCQCVWLPERDGSPWRLTSKLVFSSHIWMMRSNATPFTSDVGDDDLT